MKVSILLAGAGAVAVSALAGDGVSYRIHGQGWAQAGRLMHASDTLFGSDVAKVSGTSMQSLGAQITVDADLGEHWSGAFGVGAYQVSHTLGSQAYHTFEPNFLNFSTFKSYIAQANLTYFRGDKGHPWFSFTAGNFSYDYNPDVKNLGLYLLRGPVYPGVLMSGFQEFDTDTTKSTQVGFKMHNAVGNFSHDLLFVNERVLPPLFDWSLAYVAKYRAFGALEIGGGVNFYRLVPYSNPLETPGRIKNNTDALKSIDTVGSAGDSAKWVYDSHQGIKLVGMFSLDPKRWFSLARLGTEDLKLYGEAAVIGLKNYGTYYDDISRRIPVMVGFNIPTFGILNLLSLEVEWYGSPHRNDLAYVGNPSAIVAPWMWQGQSLTPLSSPSPVSPGAYADSTRDNVKWSLFMQKTVSKHVRFTGQIANDHYRPSPLVNSAAGIGTTGGTQAVLTSSSDWYFMGRLGFFF